MRNVLMCRVLCTLCVVSVVVWKPQVKGGLAPTPDPDNPLHIVVVTDFILPQQRRGVVVV